MPNKMLKINRIANVLSPSTGRGAGSSKGISYFSRLGTTFSMAALTAAMSHAAFAAESPATIDELGFSSVMNDKLFSDSYQIQSQSVIKPSTAISGGFRLQTQMEIEADGRAATSNGLLLQDDPISNDRGIDIKRFSTALTSSAGTLTVGNDWTNFQDFLQDDRPVSSALNGESLTTEQVRWANGSGFSVALEKDAALDGELLVASEQASDLPSLVLSWQGADKNKRGQYSFSAMGQQLELDRFEVADETQQDLGWGLNLAGGWQFGDLFAALSVTLGNSIDNFILGRLGDRDTAVAASNPSKPGESLNINPSLNYRLSETANLHVSLNRFQTSDDDAVHGVDTLDTIHLGYSWNPWPSTRIGIEFVGKDVDGQGELNDSNAVNFAASKRF